MIWALLAFLGVPLWLCALGIAALVYRNRGLRRRQGDLPVRVLRPGKTHWSRGHALWVSDVFAWRGSPAAWNESVEQIVDASTDKTTPADRKALHRLGGSPAVVSLTTAQGAVLRVATTAEHGLGLLGPFAAPAVADHSEPTASNTSIRPS